MTTLAELSGVNRRKVSEILKRLRALRYVSWLTQKGEGGKNRPNFYRINFEAVEGVAPRGDIAPLGDRVSPQEATGVSPPQATEQPISNSLLKQPISRKRKPPPADDLDERFSEWWDQFPKQRRAGYEKCRSLYRRVVTGRKASAADLLAGVMRYSGSQDVAKGFACNPHRWLSEERWGLEPTPASAGSPDAGFRRAAKPSAVEAALNMARAFTELDGEQQ
jgi:hypothetical protein